MTPLGLACGERLPRRFPPGPRPGWAVAESEDGSQLLSSLSLSLGTSYKFRVRALNMLGESEPSAPSRPYVVSGYSGRIYERPVAGPYITFTDAVNETTIMLKWMVSGLALPAGEGGLSFTLGRSCLPKAQAGRDYFPASPEVFLHPCIWELGQRLTSTHPGSSEGTYVFGEMAVCFLSPKSEGPLS